MGKSRHLRVGIVGAGFLAETRARCWRQVRSADVAGVVARRRERAEAYAHRFDVPAVFDDLDAMLASPDIDVVDLCVPNSLHRGDDRGRRGGRKARHLHQTPDRLHRPGPAGVGQRRRSRRPGSRRDAAGCGAGRARDGRGRKAGGCPAPLRRELDLRARLPPRSGVAGTGRRRAPRDARRRVPQRLPLALLADLAAHRRRRPDPACRASGRRHAAPEACRGPAASRESRCGRPGSTPRLPISVR